MGRVDYSRDAEEDLHRISDRSTCAEIMDLAETELVRAPSKSPIEGLVQKYQNMWWRRVVRRSDLAVFQEFVIRDDDDE
jgi:hypothetical protein